MCKKLTNRYLELLLIWLSLHKLTIMIERLSTKVFSEEFKNKTERIFVTLSIVSFAIHLLLIFLKYLEILNFSDDKLLTNPIAAIYTPFSFILVYEVFLVVYYLEIRI